MVSNIVLDNVQQDSNVGDQLLRIQQQRDAVLRQQQKREDDMALELAGQLDYSKFATGTAADPTINTQLGETMQKYMARIRDNKGESMSSLLFDMQQDINKIKNFSLSAKQIRANAEQTVKSIEADNKDIDGGKLFQDIMTKSIMKVDPATGKLTLRSAEEMTPDTDYAGELIKTAPERYFRNPEIEMIKQFKLLPGNDFADSRGYYTRPGVKAKGSWEAKDIKGFQEVVKDEDGVATTTRVKREPVTIGKMKVDALPQKEYDQFIGSNANRFRFEASFNSFLKQHPNEQIRNINPYSPEADDLKRAYAFNILQGYFPDGSNFKTVKDEQKSTYVIKNELGIPNSRSGGSGDTDKKDGTDYIQAYENIDEVTTKHKQEGRPFTQVNLLGNKAQDAVLSVVRSKLGSNNIGIGDIKLMRDGNGNVTVVTAQDIYDGAGENAPLLMGKNKTITTLDKAGIDLSVNKRAKEQQAILKDENNKQPVKKSIKRSDLQSKAAAAGYSVKEYEQKLKEIGVKITDN